MNIEERNESPARGWKTNKVLGCLANGPMHMKDIKAHTGLDVRTINSILYALQHQARVAPLDCADTPTSQKTFALVGETVKAVPIVRQVPFKRRSTFRSIPPNLGAVDDEVPTWLVPRMPAGLLSKQVGLVHVCEEA